MNILAPLEAELRHQSSGHRVDMPKRKGVANADCNMGGKRLPRYQSLKIAYFEYSSRSRKSIHAYMQVLHFRWGCQDICCLQSVPLVV